MLLEFIFSNNWVSNPIKFRSRVIEFGIFEGELNGIYCKTKATQLIFFI